MFTIDDLSATETVLSAIFVVPFALSSAATLIPFIDSNIEDIDASNSSDVALKSDISSFTFDASSL